MMTPTLKLKRFKIINKYKKNLKIYIKKKLKLIANYLTFLKLSKKLIKIKIFLNFLKKINV